MRILTVSLIAAFFLASAAITAEDVPPRDEQKIDRSDPRDKDGERWDGPNVPEITTQTALKRVLAASENEPVLLYKHSTQCPINARSAWRLNQWLEARGEDAPKMLYVKVIESRPISNSIAELLEVKHESPQIILLEHGKAVWNTSHEEITAENLDKALAEHPFDAAAGNGKKS